MKFKLGSKGATPEPVKRTEKPGDLEKSAGSTPAGEKPAYQVAKTSNAQAAPASQPVDDKPRYQADFLYVEGLTRGEGDREDMYKVRFITGPSKLVGHSLVLSRSDLKFVSERTNRWKDTLKEHPRYAEFTAHPENVLGYFPLLVATTQKSS